MATKIASLKQPSDGSASTVPTVATRTTTGAALWLEAMTLSGHFIAQRVAEDLKTQQAFLRCRTPAEIMQVQVDYCKTAVEQYAAEASRVREIMSGAMGAPLSPFKSIFSRDYDDVPV